MSEEFNLSNKIGKIIQWYGIDEPANHDVFKIKVEDVKEFMRLLKEFAKKHDDTMLEDGTFYNPDCNQSFTEIIDELAGDKLK